MSNLIQPEMLLQKRDLKSDDSHQFCIIIIIIIIVIVYSATGMLASGSQVILEWIHVAKTSCDLAPPVEKLKDRSFSPRSQR